VPLYVNPLTGRYTHLSVDKAARVIQSLARSWFLRLFRLDAQAFSKCVDFEKTAKTKFEKNRNKLACIINYALFAFALKRDEKLSRSLLNMALELADTNPIVTRILATQLLSTCEAPIMASREKATTLLRDAQLRDSDRAKFLVARNIFKFACLRKPKDAHVIMNLGLIEYFVFDNKEVSEALFRRAVSILPFDERIFSNWNYMRDFFPEKSLLFRPKNHVEKLKQSGVSAAGKRKVIHGREVTEDPMWAGWLYARSGATTLDTKISKEYWYNPATGEETFDIPDFDQEWVKRLYRSYFQESKNGIEQYYDPLTACYFQRHPLTETYS
jgi:hypothetical protein